jgi:hypothetical protein
MFAQFFATKLDTCKTGLILGTLYSSPRVVCAPNGGVKDELNVD